MNERTLQRKMAEIREAMTRVNTKANPKITEVFQFLKTPAGDLKEAWFELIIILKTLNPLFREHKIPISELRSPNIRNLSLSQDKLLMTRSKLSLPSFWRTKASDRQMKNIRKTALHIVPLSSSLQHLE